MALGASLACERLLTKIAFGLAGLTLLWGVGAAVVLAGRDAGRPLSAVTSASSTALAWGAGVLVAVTASMRALRDDRARGLRALARSGGVDGVTYAAGRVLGLACVLFVVVGGGALATGLASFALAPGLRTASRAALELVGSFAYALGYALVIAPMAMASLGARSRQGGFLRFWAVLVLPLWLLPWSSGLVPAAWGDLLSVPSALSALRTSLASPGALDVALAARSILALAAFAALSFGIVLAELKVVDAGQPEGSAP